jgi:transposase, IS5 family
MRADNPQISFADVEFLNQGVHLDPLLEKISGFIGEHPELADAVRSDLERGLKNPKTGRDGLSANRVLRSLILMRVKDWDYRELRERINDGYTLRHFTGFHSEPVPKHNAFNQAFNRIRPVTMKMLNDTVIAAAVKDGLEDGKKLRVDTTVAETNVHWPTDATLLWDVVRVLIRLIGRLREIVPADVPRFPNRKRAARRRMQKLQRMTAAQRKNQQLPVYKELLTITKEVLANADRAVEATRLSCGKSAIEALTLAALHAEITEYCQLGLRVVDQARRRVLEQEQVPTSEKIYSIFEPHTDLIKRGKVNKPVEFGHKIFLAESARGLVTQYRVLKGNPSDEDHVKPALDNHKITFGAAPEIFAGDRGFDNPDNQNECVQAGVACPSIPQRGGQKTAERQALEKTPEFKKAQRFRAGIEGRISVLFRGRGMKRCLAQGSERFESFIGAAVLTNNLMKIAHLLIKKTNKKLKTARARAA